MKTNRYDSVWQKYIPVVRILLKKSAAEQQALLINRVDFERAGISRKSGYKFEVGFTNGKPDTIFIENELVQSFIAAIQNDETIHQHLLLNSYTFTFSTNYQLQIKNTGLLKEAIPVLADTAPEEE